jgi:hypothetical protein
MLVDFSPFIQLNPRRFIQLLSLNYVYIPRLDHLIYIVLAAGYFSIGIVSNLLATFLAVQVTRHSSGWCFWFIKEHYYVTRQVAAKVVAQTNRSREI